MRGHGTLRGDDEQMRLEAGSPATSDTISAAEAALGHRLPEHYRDFLAVANGCEGATADGYVALWEVGTLAQLNEAYAVEELAPGLLLIGSDGGGTAYALDRRREGAPVVALPFVPMARDEARDVGATIRDLLRPREADSPPSADHGPA